MQRSWGRNLFGLFKESSAGQYDKSREGKRECGDCGLRGGWRQGHVGLRCGLRGGWRQGHVGLRWPQQGLRFLSE